MGDIITEALARQARRPEPKRIDYERMNRIGRSQKAALTRAMNRWRKAKAAGDEAATRYAAVKVAETCRKAVAEWNEIGAWRDDWATWNIALQDVTDYRLGLDDL